MKSMDEAREEDPVRRAEQDLIMIWRTQLGASATHTAASLIEKANQHQTRIASTNPVGPTHAYANCSCSRREPPAAISMRKRSATG